MILFYAQNVSFKLVGKQLLKNWIKEVISACESSAGNINFIFTSDDDLLRINKKFLQHNYYTDVITFDTSDYAAPLTNISSRTNGDIFISLDTVLTNSKTYSNSFTSELYRVMIHGILHLLGYNDSSDDEQKSMRQAENFALDLLKNSFPDFPSQKYL